MIAARAGLVNPESPTQLTISAGQPTGCWKRLFQQAERERKFRPE